MSLSLKKFKAKVAIGAPASVPGKIGCNTTRNISPDTLWSPTKSGRILRVNFRQGMVYDQLSCIVRELSGSEIRTWQQARETSKLQTQSLLRSTQLPRTKMKDSSHFSCRSWWKELPILWKPSSHTMWDKVLNPSGILGHLFSNQMVAQLTWSNPIPNYYNM